MFLIVIPGVASQDGHPRGDPRTMEKLFLTSPGRDLFSHGRGFQFAAILGTDIFVDTAPSNCNKIRTHIFRSFSMRGRLPSFPMDRLDPRTPDLYDQRFDEAPPLSQQKYCSSFSAGPGHAHHPALCCSLCRGLIAHSVGNG